MHSLNLLIRIPTPGQGAPCTYTVDSRAMLRSEITMDWTSCSCAQLLMLRCVIYSYDYSVGTKRAVRIECGCFNCYIIENNYNETFYSDCENPDFCQCDVISVIHKSQKYWKIASFKKKVYQTLQFFTVVRSMSRVNVVDTSSGAIDSFWHTPQWSSLAQSIFLNVFIEQSSNCHLPKAVRFPESTPILRAISPNNFNIDFEVIFTQEVWTTNVHLKIHFVLN